MHSPSLASPWPAKSWALTGPKRRNTSHPKSQLSTSRNASFRKNTWNTGIAHLPSLGPIGLLIQSSAPVRRSRLLDQRCLNIMVCLDKSRQAAIEKLWLKWTLGFSTWVVSKNFNIKKAILFYVSPGAEGCLWPNETYSSVCEIVGS